MICCVTGHRPKGFPFSRDEDSFENMKYRELLRETIIKLVHQGYFDFITGMAEGADMDFAESVLDVKNALAYDGITPEAALPCPASMPKRPIEFHYQRDEVLRDCDKVTILSSQYYRGCMQKRNRYMVDKSDMVLAIWNGKQEGGTWDTIKYAQKRKKPICYIMLDVTNFMQSICMDGYLQFMEKEDGKEKAAPAIGGPLFLHCLY